mmetsp:Transcript_36017/g.74883  ORF Transcript_36017/g.74883 Transcript_36017/m.74883 type:complete len:255 (+) Transcript_36017:499-1263(+)
MPNKNRTTSTVTSASKNVQRLKTWKKMDSSMLLNSWHVRKSTTMVTTEAWLTTPHLSAHKKDPRSRLVSFLINTAKNTNKASTLKTTLTKTTTATANNFLMLFLRRPTTILASRAWSHKKLMITMTETMPKMPMKSPNSAKTCTTMPESANTTTDSKDTTKLMVTTTKWHKKMLSADTSTLSRLALMTKLVKSTFLDHPSLSLPDPIPPLDKRLLLLSSSLELLALRSTPPCFIPSSPRVPPLWRLVRALLRNE